MDKITVHIVDGPKLVLDSSKQITIHDYYFVVSFERERRIYPTSRLNYISIKKEESDTWDKVDEELFREKYSERYGWGV